MIKQWFDYVWFVLVNLLFKNPSIELPGISNNEHHTVLELERTEDNNAHAIKSPEEKMEVVPVEDKMNQVAVAAPTKIGLVRESEIDTNEETTTTELTENAPDRKHEEQSENYEAQGTAKIVGAKGFTESAADVKSSKSASRTETDEGHRKVLTTSTSSSQSYSFEETTEYECDD